MNSFLVRCIFVLSPDLSAGADSAPEGAWHSLLHQCERASDFRCHSDGGVACLWLQGTGTRVSLKIFHACIYCLQLCDEIYGF